MTLPPIYVAADQVYQVDTCRPQKLAIDRGQIKVYGLGRGNYPGTPLADDELEGLSALGYWDAVGRQDWGLEMHRNEGLELSYLETGQLPFVVDGHDYLLRPGDLTITRPWQLHCLGDPHIRVSRHYWIIIDVGVRRPNQSWQWPGWVILEPDELEDLTGLLRQNETPVWAADATIQSSFAAVGAALRRPAGPAQRSAIKIAVNQLLAAIVELLRGQKIQKNPRLTTAQRAVELFLEDLARNRSALAEPWTLTSMAEHCGLSVPTFVHYCKLHANMTPMNYLNYLRVEHACALLTQSGGPSVTQTAYQCGFSSSQYFATVFQKAKGRSPSDWRKKQTGQR